MSTSDFPFNLDSIPNPTASNPLDSASYPHASIHTEENDSIEAVESSLQIFAKENAFSYGAKGDGTTDDTTALQTMLNDMAGVGACYIPGGTFKCSSGGLRIPSDTHLVMDGTIMAEGGNGFQLDGASNFIIEGLGTLDGNGVSSAGIYANTAASNGRISGITVTGFAHWPINITAGSSNITLVGMTMTNCVNSAEFVNCTNCWVDRCYLNGVGDYGWSFYGGDTHCGLTNSVIVNGFPCAGVLSDPGSPAGCTDILVANNVFVTANSSAANQQLFYIVNNEGTASGNHSQIVVRGNVMHGGSSNNGGYAVLISGCSDVIFEGNTVHDTNATTAVELSNVARARVMGNVIENVAEGGSAGVGIHLDTNATMCLVEHNSIYDTQGSPTTKYGISGTGGASTYNVVRDNWGYGFASGGALVSYTAGASDTVSGNVTG